MFSNRHTELAAGLLALSFASEAVSQESEVNLQPLLNTSEATVVPSPTLKIQGRAAYRTSVAPSFVSISDTRLSPKEGEGTLRLSSNNNFLIFGVSASGAPVSYSLPELDNLQQGVLSSSNPQKLLSDQGFPSLSNGASLFPHVVVEFSLPLPGREQGAGTSDISLSIESAEQSIKISFPAPDSKESFLETPRELARNLRAQGYIAHESLPGRLLVRLPSSAVTAEASHGEVYAGILPPSALFDSQVRPVPETAFSAIQLHFKNEKLREGYQYHEQMVLRPDHLSLTLKNSSGDEIRLHIEGADPLQGNDADTDNLSERERAQRFYQAAFEQISEEHADKLSFETNQYTASMLIRAIGDWQIISAETELNFGRNAVRIEPVYTSNTDNEQLLVKQSVTIGYDGRILTEDYRMVNFPIHGYLSGAQQNASMTVSPSTFNIPLPFDKPNPRAVSAAFIVDSLMRQRQAIVTAISDKPSEDPSGARSLSGTRTLELMMPFGTTASFHSSDPSFDFSTTIEVIE